jgi:hypothetical protein
MNDRVASLQLVNLKGDGAQTSKFITWLGHRPEVCRCGTAPNTQIDPFPRSLRTLSPLPIVMIFSALPMDSIVRLLRIEGLNLPARAAFTVSMDAAPRGGHAK